VRLIVKNASGIDDEIKTNYITVFASPTVSFTANLTTACAPAAVQFTDHSTSPPGSSITSWLWDFGDGGTSAQQNPSHTYTNTGFYTVTLQVTNSNGCKELHQSADTSGLSVASTSISRPYNQQPASHLFLLIFRDQSAGPGTLSYAWNFGNGSTSTAQNPSTTYNTAGTYSVKLSVKSDLGCSGTTTKDVIVAGKTTDFTSPGNICVGQTVNFQNNSVPAPVSSHGPLVMALHPLKLIL
jgi:PKD repeat protein